MTAHQAVYTAGEFELESRYLETVVWDAMAIEPGTKALFCGYGPDGEPVRHAIAAGVDATVIEHRDEEMRRFANIGAKLLRGSTSVIPAKENAFDVAVAFHYLHEIDPFFHAQVLSELARVARRVAIVEPAPPGDALGKRIALLYSQAKRELGQFEYYQPMEYWKKLLQAVKAEVSQHVFAFSKIPPREYLLDTIELLLRTMEVEEAPEGYITELREIARRADQLLPPPRYVLVGAALGELVEPQFTSREAVEATIKPPVKLQKPKPAPAAGPAPSSAPPASAPPPADRPVTPDEGYEFPPVEAPAPKPAAAPPPAPAAEAPAPGFSPGLPLGAPPPPPQPAPAPAQPKKSGDSPFGAPFAMPAPDPFGAPPAGIPPSSTWSWEPPEGGDENETPFKPG